MASAVVLLVFIPLFLSAEAPAPAARVLSAQVTEARRTSSQEPPVTVADSAAVYPLRSAQSNDLVGVVWLLALGGTLLTVGTVWKRLLAKPGPPP